MDLFNHTLKTIPIIGKHPLSYAKVYGQKMLENLQFKRLYLTVRQESPWKATLVMDLKGNSNAKNTDTVEDFNAYLSSKATLSEILISQKSVFAHLQAKWISELGHQPDRLRIIYGKDQDFMEYNIRLSLFEKEKVLIQVK